MSLLTQTAEYALRATAYLAHLPDAGPDARRVTSQTLGEATGIPRLYVPKVLRQLAEAGLVDAEKGHRGGYRLARPPAAITFHQVLQAAGGDIDTARCGFGWDECCDEHACPLHESLCEIRLAFRAWATRTTLASVAEGHAGLWSQRAALRDE